MEILDFLPIKCAVSDAKRRQHTIAMFKTQNLENVVTTEYIALSAHKSSDAIVLALLNVVHHGATKWRKKRKVWFKIKQNGT
jgi:hypothetical protein